MSDVAVGSGSFVGEGAALLAAVLWAAATLMFGRMGKRLAPLVLNVAKGLCAIAMMLLTLLVTAVAQPFATVLPALPAQAILLLLLSGALGIGVGDTAYFAAINTLGARRALLLETLAPPMAAVMAWLFLGEQLSLGAIAGITFTLGGIAWVISERVPGVAVKSTSTGVRTALLATFCQAAGAVLSRAALADTVVPPLWSSVIRLLAGLAFMVGLAVSRPHYLKSKYSEPKYLENSAEVPSAGTQPERLGTVSETEPKISWRTVLLPLRSPKLILEIAVVSFFATYLGIWLQQVALKYAATGVAQALLATSPLFVLPMAAVLGDRISGRAVLGALIALCGVWILLLGT